MRTQTESRWIVLDTDGRHVSLGRSEPSEAEVASASDALAAQGLSGWLARMQGDYYSRGEVALEPMALGNSYPKPITAPEPAGFKAAPISGVSLGRAAGKATASQHATDLIRCCNVFPSIITIRIGEAGRCHILPPQRRTPLPNLPSHIEATIGSAPKRKQPNCAGIIEPECLSIHPIVVPSTTPGMYEGI